MTGLRVTIAQTPVYAGNLADNRLNILVAAEQGVEENTDIVITPEMALTGYPIDDLLGDPDFRFWVRRELDYLATVLPHGPLIAVGTPLWVDDLPDDIRATLTMDGQLDAAPRNVVNALVLFKDGQEVGYVIKHLLPTYGVFDDARWFASGPSHSPLVTVNGVHVGFAICEDVWTPDVISELHTAGADAVIIANASPYAEGKHAERLTLLTGHATRTGLPLVYVNTVGGQDEVVYDGASIAMDATGAILTQLPAFTPFTCTLDLIPGERTTLDPLRPPVGTYPELDEATYMALVTALRDYVNRSGVAGVILGLSGGLDSALAATIAVDALGHTRVHGIAMPGPYSSAHSITDAVDLAENLQLGTFTTLSITDTYHAEKALLGDLLTGPGAQVADENIQARLRALHLMTLANARNLIVVNTGNKSEASVGYFTLGGDSSGGFAILKDVYKTRAYRLAQWRNNLARHTSQIPPIPESTLLKPPSAELAPDQQDTDSLPPYAVLDTILRLYLEDRASRADIAAILTTDHDYTPDDAETTTKRVLGMVNRAEHKRRQVAPGVKVTDCSYGRDRRYPIVNKFTGYEN